MTKQQESIPLDGELHPIGTLMYEDLTTRGNQRPQRNIWRVVAHRECQEFDGAPARMACAMEFVRQEALEEKK